MALNKRKIKPKQINNTSRPHIQSRSGKGTSLFNSNNNKTITAGINGINFAAWAAAKPLGASSEVSTRVLISNLPNDISGASVQEYFSQAIGPIKNRIMHFNEEGNPLGTCILTFINTKDAQEAALKYNGIGIDGGKSRLRVELLVDGSKKPLAARIHLK